MSPICPPALTASSPRSTDSRPPPSTSSSLPKPGGRHAGPAGRQVRRHDRRGRRDDGRLGRPDAGAGRSDRQPRARSVRPRRGLSGRRPAALDRRAGAGRREHQRRPAGPGRRAAGDDDAGRSGVGCRARGAARRRHRIGHRAAESIRGRVRTVLVGTRRHPVAPRAGRMEIPREPLRAELAQHERRRPSHRRVQPAGRDRRSARQGPRLPRAEGAGALQHRRSGEPARNRAAGDESVQLVHALDANVSRRHLSLATLGMFPGATDFATVGTFTPPEASVNLRIFGKQVSVMERALWTDRTRERDDVSVVRVAHRRRSSGHGADGAAAGHRRSATSSTGSTARRRLISSSMRSPRIETASAESHRVQGRRRCHAHAVRRHEREPDSAHRARRRHRRASSRFLRDRERSGGWRHGSRGVRAGPRAVASTLVHGGGRSASIATACCARERLAENRDRGAADESGTAVLRGGWGLFVERTPSMAGAFTSFESPVDTRFTAGAPSTAPGVPVTQTVAPDLQTPASRTWDAGFDYRWNERWAFHAGVLSREGRHELIVAPVAADHGHRAAAVERRAIELSRRRGRRALHARHHGGRRRHLHAVAVGRRPERADELLRQRAGADHRRQRVCAAQYRRPASPVRSRPRDAAREVAGARRLRLAHAACRTRW